MQISPQCLNIGDFYLRGGHGLVTTQSAKKVSQNFYTILFFKQEITIKSITLYQFKFFFQNSIKRASSSFMLKNIMESLDSKLLI